MDVTELSDRAVRSVNRDAVREALESSSLATTTTEAETEQKTIPGSDEKGADDKNVTIDRQLLRDRRAMSPVEYSWQSASSQQFRPTTRTVPDSFALPAFNGTNTDADTWLAHFQRYAEYCQLTDQDITAIFPLFLKDSAIDWYDALSAELKNDGTSLMGNFKSHFGKTELDYVFDDETVFTRVQRANEKARDYNSQMQKLAKRVPHLRHNLLQLWCCTIS